MNNEAEPKLTKDDMEQMLNTGIKDYQVKNLTEAGDNMGSILLAVNVTLKTGKVIYLVAKTYPEDAVITQVFNSPLSMRKEIDMYQVVIPEFHRVQEDHTIPPPRRLDLFCTCVAARATRRGGNDGSRLADENSVILLDNLKVLGFSSTDRISGMDLPHAELLVAQLAKFHATGIALKTNKPLLFRNKITKVLTPVKTRLDDREFESKMKMEYLEALTRGSLVLEENRVKLEKIFNEYLEYLFSEGGRTPLEPYATIVHNDLWTNNILFRYRSSPSADSKPVAVKIIDFQLPSYGSPVSDLIFFLFTSVKSEVLADSLDNLLKLYHDNFVQWLSSLGCNTLKFSWTSFTKELSIFSVLELSHTLGMLNVVMIQKEDAENMSKDPRENENGFVLKDDLIQRASQIVSIFVEKGWL